ncbi:MAG: pyridoxamine 5'-phosphate oxidase family protein [Candidatus Thorarchaeota archaeon]|nr:pyridoxamine 5'-phosphate oxidase family protein [Candidatus Thorarchaeota archaeon]
MKKTYPEKMTFSEVWPLFEKGGLIHLSTVDGNHPRVRIVSVNVFDKKLWVVTRSGDDKVTQIRKNPNIEFTLAVQGKERTGCLRVTGTASIIEDQQVRNDVASSVPWFSGYWESCEDPNFTLIRLDMKKVLFDHHETSSKYTIAI